MQPNVLTEYLGISYPKWLDGTNTGGSAFIFHLQHAYQAIKNNICNNVLILYGSTQKSNKERNFLDRPAIFSSQFDMVAGLPSPVGAYALAAQRHMYEFNSNKETLAEIALAARNWAKLNPNAYKKDNLTIDDIINSQPICSPLNKLDCCLVTDGGGAIVLSHTDRKSDFKSDPIFIKGFGETSSHSSINYMEDMSRLDVAIKSSEDAYNMSKLSPKDIDFAMIYDSFTITVLMSLEALGFCEIGEGKDFVKNGNLGPNGSFPINTNGGGLSYCHPGMYSIFTLIEACRQLWGHCGERQLKKNLNNVLCHGTGGVLSSAATTILSKESS
jgi:acetyl-CoA acetyltransferase